MSMSTGRESEVFRLGAAWGAAVRGRPALVLLAGGAGLGKTRLAAEAVRLAGETGGTVLTARCYESETSLFARPLVAAIGGPAMINGSEPADEIIGLLHEMVARKPVLLVVDDLQYAGRTTVDLLKRAAGGTGTRLLVVAAARPTEGAATLEALADIATRLDLGPLPAAAVRRLAADAGRPDLAGPILERTRGHPMFAAEALDSPELPESLADAVLGRIRRTSGPTEPVLRAAAVLGTPVDPAVLARLMDRPLPVIAECCEAARSAGFLIAAGQRYEFATGAVREILYESTPHDVRLGFHRRAADLLSHRPEALAAHAVAGADWVRAERAWRRAAADAVRRGTPADAEALLAKAAEAAARG